MLPWKTIITIQQPATTPVYLQIANSIIGEIKSGVIKAGIKMPGTREMSRLLKVHRQTVVNAYHELDAQGWTTSIPSRGTFIEKELPEIGQRKKSSENKNSFAKKTGFSIEENPLIITPVKTLREITGFHDGADVRLVPVEQLARAYRNVINRKHALHHLSYIEANGRYALRKVLSDELNGSRGLQTTPENIFITRGSQMAIYFVVNILISKGDAVITGETSFYYADTVITMRGANLLRVPVDEFGLDTDAIEQLCKRRKIRAVYITPHHHFPTTVSLSAARRMKLLKLSEEYGFIIIEDDYDYDFHYQSNPILPLASGDRKGMVVYLGTFSKSLAPSIRIGYIAAPENLMLELSRFRQIIDVQGDPFLEQAIAEMFELGEIRRHMKKSLKEYQLRRDSMCALLKDKLSDIIEFKIPDGGLAVWAKYDRSIKLPELSVRLRKKQVILSNGLIYNKAPGKNLNANRMGFGWMNTEEAEKAVKVLHQTIRE